MLKLSAVILSLAVVGMGCGIPSRPELKDEIVGSWVAYRDNVVQNMWTFYSDGECENTGFIDVPASEGGYDTQVFIVEGKYVISGDIITVKVIGMSSENISLDTKGTALADSTILLNDIVIDRDRLLYSNVSGMPVVYKRGS